MNDLRLNFQYGDTETRHLDFIIPPCLCVSIFIFFLYAAPLFSQPRNTFAIEGTFHYGAIWRHTPKLTTQTGEALAGEELGLRIQTRGRRDWQQWQRYPALGVTICHFRLGEGSHGEAFGLLPNLLVPIYRKNWFTAVFRVGTGIAWVSKPYNAFTNSGQNAIGSHWNNITQFRFGAEARLSPHLRMQTGGALTHFSNGGSALPNLGVNFPAGYASLIWSPKHVLESEFAPAQSSKHATRRFGGQLQAGLANIEYSIPDGPKYPVWQASAAGMFYLNKTNRLLLGLDYEYNKAVRAWGLHIGDLHSDAEARDAATRLALFLSDEFVFGDFGIEVQRGWYLGNRFNQYVLRKAYSKLIMRYYFPRLAHTSIQPNFGITLKAHAAIAEFIAWNVGMVF